MGDNASDRRLTELGIQGVKIRTWNDEVVSGDRDRTTALIPSGVGHPLLRMDNNCDCVMLSLSVY